MKHMPAEPKVIVTVRVEISGVETLMELKEVVDQIKALDHVNAAHTSVQDWRLA